MSGPWEQYQAAPAAGPWEQYAQAPRQMTPLTADPTGGAEENALAASGKALADAARGAVLRSSQALSLAPDSLPGLQLLNVALEKLGLSPKAAVSDAKNNIAESRKLDAPLMATGGGKVGNIATTALLLAPTAAANTPAAAGVVGGLTGLLQPALTAKETAMNTGLGAAGGMAGQWVANKLPGLLQGRVNTATANQAANAQKFQAARAASKDGYVIPPADLEPGAVSEAVSGLSGKIKTAQVASQRNQTVTDALAKKALGLAPDQTLDTATLQGIRQNAATAGYAPVRGAGTVAADQQFFNTLDNIAATSQGAAKSFPGLADNGVPDLIATLKQPTFDAGDAIDATKVLRAAADKAYAQGDKTLGKANRAAADAIEGMLDRHLQAAGNPDALQAFRTARELIAKTYSVERGLNPQTGNVSAQALAKQLAKGKPLSGELLTIAQTATAFPKATQALKEAPKAVSPLDFAVATTTGAATGNPLAAAMLGARPVARNVLLSKLVQQRALQQTPPVPFTQATQKLLENRLAQLLLGPVGTTAALNIGQQ